MASGDTIQGAFIAISLIIDAKLRVRQTDHFWIHLHISLFNKWDKLFHNRVILNLFTRKEFQSISVHYCIEFVSVVAIMFF